MCNQHGAAGGWQNFQKIKPPGKSLGHGGEEMPLKGTVMP